MKDEFLATTSHELRTPLTAILGYSAILKEEVPEDHREFVNIIESSGERLMTTLTALLDLARLRAGTMEVNRERVDIGALLLEVADKASIAASEKNVAVELTLPPGSARGWMDRYAFQRIVENVVGNAVKFTEEGRVNVVLEWLPDERLRLVVADTGVGIDSEFLPSLFDEFRQESGGLARSHGGAGLGLAVTSRLVDLLGGEIAVTSEKEVGSRFEVVLPVSLSGEGYPEQAVGGGAPDRDAIARFSNSDQKDGDPSPEPTS